MADEVVTQDPAWRWYVGMAPALGWDMVFEGPVDLMETMPDRVRIRKPSKATINGKQLHMIPWAVWYFGLISGEVEAVVDRKLFILIQPLELAAAEEARKSWLKDPPKPEGVIIVDEETAEEQTEAAVASAQRKVALARELKGGAPFRKV